MFAAHDRHLGRRYLKGRDGDAAAGLLSIVVWLRELLRLLLIAILRLLISQSKLIPSS